MRINSLLFSALLTSVSAVEAASVDYSSTDDLTSLAPGEGFSIQVRGSGFTVPVVGGAFAVSFDQPGIAQLYDAIIDTSVFNLGGGISGGTGDVFFNAFSLDPAGLPVGSFNIGTLVFTSSGVGSVDIALGPGTLKWSTTGGDEITDITYGQPLSAVVVPVPAALPLLGSALVALGFTGLTLRRRKRPALCDGRGVSVIR